MSPGLLGAHQLGRLADSISRLAQQQASLQATAHHIATAQDAARHELYDLRCQFAEFLRRDEMSRNLQLAQIRIIAVRQQLDTEYGHFGEVRRQATGVLQALDVGIVTKGTIHQLSEELMVGTPRYWLAPALVALAAWIKDDVDLAGRALREAVRRNNDKASLFFMLVHRRHSRMEATARWVRQYVARQDPAALPQEFAVVLEAATTGALGPPAKTIVLEQLTAWHERLCADRSTVVPQVQRWQRFIDGMRTAVGERYTVLPTVSPTWPLLKAIHEGATVHGRAEEHFRAVLDGPPGLSDELQKRVDDILVNLITNFDEEEAPLRHEEARLQATVDHNGDLAAAANAGAALAPAHAERVDALALVTSVACFPGRFGVSRTTQRLAVVLAKDWIVAASEQLRASNLQAAPSAIDLTIDGWFGRIDGQSTEESLVSSAAAYVDAQTWQAVRQASSEPVVVSAVGGGVALALALLAFVSGSAGFGTFLLFVSMICGAASALSHVRLGRRRAFIVAQGTQRKAHLVASVRGAIAEAVDWHTAWGAELAKADSLRSFAAALNRDAHLEASPDLRREVQFS